MFYVYVRHLIGAFGELHFFLNLFVFFLVCIFISIYYTIKGAIFQQRYQMLAIAIYHLNKIQIE